MLGKFITFWCDNPTVVKAIKKGSITFKAHHYYQKANLVKVLALLALKYNFHFTAKEILGKNNQYADILSRKDENLRKLVYSLHKEKMNIPVKQATKLINLTCKKSFVCPLNFIG